MAAIFQSNTNNIAAKVFSEMEQAECLEEIGAIKGTSRKTLSEQRNSWGPGFDEATVFLSELQAAVKMQEVAHSRSANLQANQEL